MACDDRHAENTRLNRLASDQSDRPSFPFNASHFLGSFVLSVDVLRSQMDKAPEDE